MTLLEPLREMARRRADLVGTDGEGDPFAIPVDEVHSATEATIRGRRTVMAGTNNYLGLTFDPECVRAASDALRSWGTGTTGSRMANGSYAHHLALERELADFLGRKGAMVFSTGYQANLGIVNALLGPGDVAMLDGDCHASIYDGCAMSGADVFRFRHNDPESLDRRLARLGDRTGRTLVIVEGLYSMLGDRVPLREIAEVTRRRGCLLMVDEAHSFGVLGEHGRGQAEATGVEADVDFVVGTFSKSLGGIGGFAASDHPELELVRFASRPYIFTASLPPSVVASTRKALEIIRTRKELRECLWQHAHTVYDRLRSAGYELGPDVGPVIAARLSSSEHAVRFWRELLERGVYVNLMLPPATPRGEALVRCSITAAHTPRQIVRICEAFEALSG